MEDMKKKEYLIRAANGQVLLASMDKEEAKRYREKFELSHPGDVFTIEEYEAGKYGHRKEMG